MLLAFGLVVGEHFPLLLDELQVLLDNLSCFVPFIVILCLLQGLHYIIHSQSSCILFVVLLQSCFDSALVFFVLPVGRIDLALVSFTDDVLILIYKARHPTTHRFAFWVRSWSIRSNRC